MMASQRCVHLALCLRAFLLPKSWLLTTLRTAALGCFGALSFAAIVKADPPPCSGMELQVAKDTLPRAKKALDLAVAALDRPSTSDTRAIADWLGARSSQDLDGVKQKLQRTRAFLDGVTFRCAVNTDSQLGDVYGYVDPTMSFVITLGAFFFQAPDSGLSSKMGVIVHETSHFVLAGATKDPKIYGPDAAKALARSDPTAAQSNAENLEYFVESVASRL